MKTLTTLMALAAIFPLVTTAQFECGSDEYREMMEHRSAQGVTEEAMDHYIHLLNLQRSGGGESYTIPVVVHVIHENGPELISDAMVLETIDRMNEGFSNTGAYFQVNGVNTGFQFCLAQQDPEGNATNGINYVQSSLTVFDNAQDDQTLKDLIRWDTEKYFNVWVVRDITSGNGDPVAYATFPFSHGDDNDGVVTEYIAFESEDGATIMMHETAHYLGLYHTFQGGCSNADCQLEGDKVCDTPPDGQMFGGTCEDGANSCSSDEDDLSDNNPYRPIGLGGLGDQPDMKDNYMDYSSLQCFERFTEGQKQRMLSGFEGFRLSLTLGNQCYHPCENPVVANLNPNTNVLEVDELLSISNLSSNYTSVEWFIDEISVSTDVNLEWVFDVQGSYEVTANLEGNQPGCSATETWIILVTCSIDVEVNCAAPFAAPGEEISLSGNATGGATLEWQVDGETVGFGNTLDYTFESTGGYQIVLSASNGTCTVASEACFVLVGTCNSGREAYNWITYTDGAAASVEGFDFNDNTVGELDELGLGYSECKATLCDASGNLILTSNGQNVYGSDLSPIPNGTGLSGHFSSRRGALFVKAPGSDNLIYLFTSSSNEQNFANGLRYSLIDMSLNGGNGAVTEIKNVLIAITGQESITAIRHCNLIDFWLISYDTTNQEFKVWLVTEEGLSDTELSFSIPISFAVNSEYKVHPRGDKFMIGKYLFNFDNSSGGIELVGESGIDILFADFSPNGRYIYFSTGLSIARIDLQTAGFDFGLNAVEIDVPFLPLFSDFQTTPLGKMILASAFGDNDYHVIHLPNHPNLDNIDLEVNAGNSGGLINSLGNYYHAYVSQEAFYIDGPAELCANNEATYSLVNCVDESLSWEIPDGVEVISMEDQAATFSFNAPGEYVLKAMLDLSCGLSEEEIIVQVIDNPIPDLGTSMALCEGAERVFDAGGGYMSYEWQDGSSGQTYTATEAGTYSVTVTNSNGCSGTSTVVIPEVITGVIDLGPDDEICDGLVLVLDIGDEFIDPVWQDGTEGPEFTVFQAGTYTVTATLPCPASDSIVVDDCGFNLEVNENSSGNWMIYPNPGSGLFSVQVPEGLELNEIAVFDLSGRMIYSQTYGAQDSRTMLLDLGTLAAGTYLLQAELSSFRSTQMLILER